MKSALASIFSSVQHSMLAALAVLCGCVCPSRVQLSTRPNLESPKKGESVEE